MRVREKFREGKRVSLKDAAIEETGAEENVEEDSESVPEGLKSTNKSPTAVKHRG